MTFFDTNSMLGELPNPLPGGTLDAPGLLREMDHYGIEKTLFFHYAYGEGDMKDEMNRRTLAAARRSDRLIPTWVLSTGPVRVGEAAGVQITRMLDAGVRAARFYPDETGCAGPLTIKTYAIEGLLQPLNEHHIPLLIPESYLHGQPTTHSPFPRGSYEDIDAICGQFPDLPIVVLQPSYTDRFDLIALAQRHKNLHFTIPIYSLFRLLENTAGLIGADRLLFGTNMPYSDPALGIGMVQYSVLGESEKKLIAGGNLRRLLDGVR
ncbi:MAG TPA: amidohydrolase family protein [Bryobacteraceae bacterium]|nr:amidohydrolase family protein [Bryobacteraceae bacterium]